MTSSTRIAVLRISLDVLREQHEIEDAGDGWSSFEGADGTRLEIVGRGSALLVRFEGSVGALAASFGELWRHHEEPRGVAVHEQAPEGDDYEALVEDASWEGGLFAQAATMLGGKQAKTDDEDEAGEGEDGKDDGEGEDAFDKVADKLMSAVDKRSSRKVLAARLAAEKGQKDLGDVLDAMASEDAEGDDALVAEVEDRFAFDPEHQDMAKLLERKLDSGGEGDEDGEDQAEGEDAGEKAGENAAATAQSDAGEQS